MKQLSSENQKKIKGKVDELVKEARTLSPEKSRGSSELPAIN